MSHKSVAAVHAATLLAMEGAGLLVATLNRDAMRLYATSAAKPPLSPPAVAFTIAWTILYALLAVGIARVILAEPSPGRSWAVPLFVFQMALNLAWPFVFFADKSYALALVLLLSSIVQAVATTFAFRMVDPLATRLQLPYLTWLCFAAYLNLGVVVLN